MDDIDVLADREGKSLLGLKRQEATAGQADLTVPVFDCDSLAAWRLEQDRDQLVRECNDVPVFWTRRLEHQLEFSRQSGPTTSSNKLHLHSL